VPEARGRGPLRPAKRACRSAIRRMSAWWPVPIPWVSVGCILRSSRSNPRC